MEFVITLHSIIRWVVVAAAVVALVLSLVTWLRNEQNGQADRKAMAAFTGTLDLQLLLGIILLLWAGFSRGGGGFPRYRLEHAVTMVIAVILAHLSALWKRRVPAVRARNSFFLIIVVLALIWAGVNRLPQGWGLKIGQ